MGHDGLVMEAELSDQSPSEAQRARRRDRRRETRMVVDGAGIRRQAQALGRRAVSRRAPRARPPGAQGTDPSG